MSHDEDHNDDWLDKDPAHRRASYAARKVVLEKIVLDVRLHRVEDCSGAPLCPGGDAARRINELAPRDFGDFLATCLAALADDREEIENLRVQLDQERARRIQGEQAHALTLKEADAGWEAYRLATEKGRLEVPPADHEDGGS